MDQPDMTTKTPIQEGDWVFTRRVWAKEAADGSHHLAQQFNTELYLVLEIRFPTRRSAPYNPPEPVGEYPSHVPSVHIGRWSDDGSWVQFVVPMVVLIHPKDIRELSGSFSDPGEV